MSTIKEALEEIARQKLADALSPQEYADADFEGAYDCCIRRARAALAALADIEGAGKEPSMTDSTEAMKLECTETVARAICISQGEDPDSVNVMKICGAKNEPLPLWMYYSEHAEAAIVTLASSRPSVPGEAERALREAIALIEEAHGRGLGDWDFEAAARLPELRAALSTDRLEEKPARHDEGVLPCDVIAAPATVFRKGVKISVLLAALERRSLTAKTDEGPPAPRTDFYKW